MQGLSKKKNPIMARPDCRIRGRQAGRFAFCISVILLTTVTRNGFAPDLKFPSLPFFNRKGDTLKETGNAPNGPGGMCILPSGETIISCHQFFHPQFNVMKKSRKGDWVPFPNAEMNTPGSGAPVILDSVLGVACDSKGVVWMLDNGRRSDKAPKLVAWDSRRNELRRIITITSVNQASFLRNLVIDPVAPFIYISDPADGINSAIVVVDLTTGLTRRALEGHRSVQMEHNVSIELDGKKVEVRRPDGNIATPLTGVSPIAIDRKGRWLYYGPRNGSTLYKIQTEFLRRVDLPPHAIAAKVEGVSPKPICDSMAIDSRDRIYFGDISRGSIDYVKPEDQYLGLRIHISDPRIIWPGGLLIGPDGNLHFFSSQLNRSSFFNGGKDVTSPPYHLFSTKPQPAPRFGFPK